jgi:hypothetical protein
MEFEIRAANDLKIKKMKNQFKKDVAILEQKNELLAENLVDLRAREEKLKKSNELLMNTLGNNKQQSQLNKLRYKAVKRG